MLCSLFPLLLYLHNAVIYSSCYFFFLYYFCFLPHAFQFWPCSVWFLYSHCSHLPCAVWSCHDAAKSCCLAISPVLCVSMHVLTMMHLPSCDTREKSYIYSVPSPHLLLGNLTLYSFILTWVISRYNLFHISMLLCGKLNLNVVQHVLFFLMNVCEC